MLDDGAFRSLHRQPRRLGLFGRIVRKSSDQSSDYARDGKSWNSWRRFRSTGRGSLGNDHAYELDPNLGYWTFDPDLVPTHPTHTPLHLATFLPYRHATRRPGDLPSYSPPQAGYDVLGHPLKGDPNHLQKVHAIGKL